MGHRAGTTRRCPSGGLTTATPQFHMLYSGPRFNTFCAKYGNGDSSEQKVLKFLSSSSGLGVLFSQGGSWGVQAPPSCRIVSAATRTQSPGIPGATLAPHRTHPAQPCNRRACELATRQWRPTRAPPRRGPLKAARSRLAPQAITTAGLGKASLRRKTGASYHEGNFLEGDTPFLTKHFFPGAHYRQDGVGGPWWEAQAGGQAGRRPTGLAGASFWTVTMAPPGPLQTVPPAHASLGAFSAPLAHSGWHAHKQAQTLERALTRTNRREGSRSDLRTKMRSSTRVRIAGVPEKAASKCTSPNPLPVPSVQPCSGRREPGWCHPPAAATPPRAVPGTHPAGPGAGALGALWYAGKEPPSMPSPGSAGLAIRPGHMAPDR